MKNRVLLPFLYTFVFLLSCGLLSSCSPELKEYKGSYSFKTAGNLRVALQYDSLATDTLPASWTDSISDWFDSLDWFGSSARVSKAAADSSGATVYYDTVNVVLNSEQGQMNVVVCDKERDRMLVTMNIMGGDALAFYALAHKDSLVLEPKERYISMQISRQTVSMPVTVSGTGNRYGNILLLHLNYAGALVEKHRAYTILESSVECVAEYNEY